MLWLLNISFINYDMVVETLTLSQEPRGVTSNLRFNSRLKKVVQSNGLRVLHRRHVPQSYEHILALGFQAETQGAAMDGQKTDAGLGLEYVS